MKKCTTLLLKARLKTRRPCFGNAYIISNGSFYSRSDSVIEKKIKWSCKKRNTINIGIVLQTVRNSAMMTRQLLNVAGTPSIDMVLLPASMLH